MITSQTSGTILKGITRDSVLTLARDWGMKVEERNVSVKEVVEAAKNGTLQEAFGVGTAATIAHIAQIGFEDEIYELGAIESREFSNRVLKTLDEIKTGRVDDKFGWTLKV